MRSRSARLSNTKKILLLWAGFIVLLVTSQLFPEARTTTVQLLSESFRFLLFVITLYIVIKEPIRKNKYIFLNFAVVFAFSIVNHLYNFVPRGTWESHYYYQYFDMITAVIALSLAIIYTVVDSLFREFKTYQKYFLALLIVGGFAAWHFHPYLEDPKYLYATEDIKDWKALDQAREAYFQEHNAQPTDAELAALVKLQVWKDGAAVADLYPEKNSERVSYLSKYLAGDNYLVLLWKPIHKSMISMNVVCMLFLLLFFGYQYKKDPPQGAYVDKIMFLFLLFCSMDALHYLGYINALNWNSTLLDVFSVGQYVTIGILIFMVLFFGLRLRFITSVKGEFYESELVHNAKHITRWRDWVDNLVVHYFLNPKALRGRLLALWTDSRKERLVDSAR